MLLFGNCWRSIGSPPQKTDVARRDLHVPFEEKDEAKLLGARWDAQARCWYVPAGVSDESFARWFQPREQRPPTPPDYSALPLNLLIEQPAIVEATAECWACRKSTPVLTVAGRDEDGDLASVTGIQSVDGPLGRALAERPYYRLAFSRTTQQWAFANLCTSCGALQGDFFLHNEPDGPFFALHNAEPHLRITELAGPVRVATDDPAYDLE